MGLHDTAYQPTDGGNTQPNITKTPKENDSFLIPNKEERESWRNSHILANLAGPAGEVDIGGINIPSTTDFTLETHIGNVFVDYLLELIRTLSEKEGNEDLTDNLGEIVRLLSEVSKNQQEAIDKIRNIIKTIPNNNIKKNISFLCDEYCKNIQGGGDGDTLKTENHNYVEFKNVLNYRMHAKFATYFTIIKYLMTLNEKSGSKINLDSIAPNIQTIKDNFFDKEENFDINYLTHIYEYLQKQTNLETEEITNITALLQKIQSIYEASDHTPKDQVNAMMAVFNLLYGYDVNVLHLFVGENGRLFNRIIEHIANLTGGDYELLRNYLQEVFEKKKLPKNKESFPNKLRKITGIAAAGLPIMALLVIFVSMANVANAMDGPHTMGYHHMPHMPHIFKDILNHHGLSSGNVGESLIQILDSIQPPQGTKRIQMGPNWGLIPDQKTLQEFKPNPTIKTIAPKVKQINGNTILHTLNAFYPGDEHNAIVIKTTEIGDGEYRCSVGDQESAKEKNLYPFDTNLLISGYKTNNGQRIPMINIGGKTLYLPGYEIYGLQFGPNIGTGTKTGVSTYAINDNYSETHPLTGIIIIRNGKKYIIPIKQFGYVVTLNTRRKDNTLSKTKKEEATNINQTATNTTSKITDEEKQEKLDQVTIVNSETPTTNIQIGDYTVGVHSLFFGPCPEAQYDAKTGIVTIKSTGIYANNKNTIEITVTEDGKYKVMVTYKGGKTEYVPSGDFYIFPTNENGENYSNNIIYIADHTENLLFTITHMPDHTGEKMFTMPKTLKIGNETINVNIEDIVYCTYIDNQIIIKIGDNLYQATLEESETGIQARGRTKISEAKEMITSSTPMNLEEIKDNNKNSEPFFVTVPNTTGQEPKIFEVVPLSLGNYVIFDYKDSTTMPILLPSINDIRYVSGHGYVFPTKTGGYQILTTDKQGSLQMNTHTSAVENKIANITMQFGTGDIQYNETADGKTITYKIDKVTTSFTFDAKGNITLIRSGDTWIIDQSGLMISGNFIITNNAIYDMNTGEIITTNIGEIKALRETIQKSGIKPENITITPQGMMISFSAGPKTNNVQLSIVSKNNKTFVIIGQDQIKIGNVKFKKVGDHMLIKVTRGLKNTYYVLHDGNPIKIDSGIGKDMFKNQGTYTIEIRGETVNVTSQINKEQP